VKVIVTSEGPDIDSNVDARFGRARYFIIIDIETLEYNAIENAAQSQGGGAGVQSAQFVIDSGVKLAVGMIREIKIPFGVIINRAELGDRHVEEYCHDEKIPIIMRIPFQRKIAVAYSNGIPLVKAFPEFRNIFKKLYISIRDGVFGEVTSHILSNNET